MRPSLLAALAALAVFTFAPAAQAGPLTDTCRGVNEVLHGPCRGGEQAVSFASAVTGLSAVDVTPFEGSWAHRALGLQYDLAGDVGLRDAPWVGTHNSFNSVAEMGPTLSDVDSNQQLTLVDQLRIGVRSLELDVHWFPALAELGARAPVVCHARGADQAHLGCSIEKTLGPVLREIRGWLNGNPGDVLLLYLEDHLEGAAGYGAGAAAVEAQLGELLYRPPSSGAACDELPLDLTRDAVSAAGKQVVVVSDCGVGAVWRAVAFDWSSHVESRPRGFQDFPDCGPDFDRETYESQIVRYFEDSTALTASLAPLGQSSVDDGITPATAARMARCGVDLTGLDQLVPSDGRLEALVWSWAPDEPAADAGDCSVQGANARWEARDCGELHPVACRAADGAWTVAGPPVQADDAAASCTATGAEHAVPRTGFENELLRVAAAGGEVWLGQRRDGAGWTALDER
ncbi:MAG: hypothetical protein WD844_07900 [Thermoleophilaceae bacterium]